MSDLWNFPSALGRSRAEALARLRDKIAILTSELFEGLSLLRPKCRQPDLRHGITYRSIMIDLYAGRTNTTPSPESARWFPTRCLNRAAISQLARKIAARIEAR